MSKDLWGWLLDISMAGLFGLGIGFAISGITI